MRRQLGLTLVELMVVVAVMAIIAAIAYPLYTNQTQKTRRADAKVALESVAMAQERYYSINGEYTGVLSSLQVSSDIQGSSSDQGYYDISLSLTGGGQGFTVTADTASAGPQARDTDCAQFTLNHQGVKGATNTKCW